MQSYQRFQCIGHMGFKGLSNAVTNTHPLLPSMGRYHAAKKLLSQWPAKRPTFAFAGESGYTTRLRQQDRTQRLTRRNRGLPDRAAITTLGAFRTFTNIPGPGVRTAYFAALGSWPGGALEERRKPAGQRCAYAYRCPAGVAASLGCVIFFAFVEIGICTSGAHGFPRVRGMGGITTLSALYVLPKRRTAACQNGSFAVF